MSDFLSTTGDIIKMPNCKTPSDCRRVWEIANEGTGLYYMNIFSLTTAIPSTIYHAGVVFYIWGLTNGVYQHPVKCTVVSDITSPNNRVHFSTDGDIQTGAVTLLCSPTFQTDLLSANQNNILSIYSHEFKMIAYTPTTNTILIDILISSYPQYGLTSKPVDGWYVIDKNGTKITAYLTYIGEVGGYAQYTFEYDYLKWIEIGGSINGIMHVETRYVVDFKIGLEDVGSFVFTPDKNFIFEINFKQIFNSLFTEHLFNEITDPMSSSYSNVIDKTDIFVKKVNVTVTMFSPNINRSSNFQFFTAPFKSTTGKGTLEQYLPPVDLQPVSYSIMTPFSKIGGGVNAYLNGTGGILGFVGCLVRNRDKSNLKTVKFSDDITTDSITIQKDMISFLMYSRKYTSNQNATVVYVEDGNEDLITSFAVRNIGIYCNQVNIMWQSPQGIGQWFFNQEYDETNSVDGTVTIVNDEENTIVNHNIKPKRRLALKTDLLGIDDRIGVASLIEAKQVWIYSYTQQRLLPCKVATNTMRIRQRDEINSIIDFEIEIESGVVL